MIKFSIFSIFIAFFVSMTAKSTQFYWEDDPDSLLSHARSLFYRSIENEETINNAQAAFRRLESFGGSWKAKAITYRGALLALKGKHAFWPHKKLEWVNKGLPLMDRGLALAPNDIEALFVHASTCWYLPFFFGRGDESEQHFRRIIDLLPTQADRYDNELIANAVAFILENLELSKNERTAISSTEVEAPAR